MKCYKFYVSEGDFDYLYDEAPASAPAPGPPRLKFVPVSQISTPPTITTTNRPYGEIVNRYEALQDVFTDKFTMSADISRDFYETVRDDSSLRHRAKQSRRVTSVGDSQAAPDSPRTERTWPLGGPYYPQPQVRNSAGVCYFLSWNSMAC